MVGGRDQAQSERDEDENGDPRRCVVDRNLVWDDHDQDGHQHEDQVTSVAVAPNRVPALDIGLDERQVLLSGDKRKIEASEEYRECAEGQNADANQYWTNEISVRVFLGSRETGCRLLRDDLRQDASGTLDVGHERRWYRFKRQDGNRDEQERKKGHPGAQDGRTAEEGEPDRVSEGAKGREDPNPASFHRVQDHQGQTGKCGGTGQRE